LQTVYPDYLDEFKCAASSCRHSCCVGWEIDIDACSLGRFYAAEGEFGDKLRRSISSEGGAHFILSDDERCPFLQGDGLCEMILTLGEDSLCDICRDHPRFRSFLPTRTEIGLGLCCEEAARLILTRKATMKLIAVGDAEPSDADELLRLRDEAISLAQDRSIPVSEREKNILELCGAGDAELSPESYYEFLLSLERLDSAWDGELEGLRYPQERTADELMTEQALCYFIYRHFPEAYEDGDLVSKARFAVLSTELLRALGGDFCEKARMYSCEIEYSQENMDAFYDEVLL